MSVVSDLRSSRELLLNLTLREIRGKYKRTALGQLWSLVNPIAQMAVYSVVFSMLLRSTPPGKGNPSGIDVFALWLSCGLLPWLFFANSVTSSLTVLVSNSNLINKVYFPRETLVIANVASWLFTHCFEMAVLVAAVLIFGGSPLVWLPVTMCFMVLLAVFSLGIGLLLSVANVYFRDTQHFVAILMQIWFYLTPIVYPIQVLSHAHHANLVGIYRLNPMERFIEVFRNTVYDGRGPTLDTTLYLVVASFGLLALGMWVFRSHQGRLAEEL